ncbi:LabA-like NYN domain-containing protein [Burkholderia sp. Ac-20379]|uniref:LabA-like NYN domain-containing protein n=1 Tax=Burkholderia sp. Ac-20379 TaxID=2703900 RepID=UPI00197EFE6D|nr:NYN domain-containing protein [Burkholderia sp. Ac-20379]MBN3725382.1 NYN domain-containing protein [Burkholderia sp. Ac-20379]
MRRIGVYVDASNIGMNGGHGMRYEALRELACRADGFAQRLNVYIAYDLQRAEHSPEYSAKALGYQSALRDQGFRVTVKHVKHFTDDEGNEVSKSNADLDMAVDVLMESERLDTVMLVTGDGDFVQVVRALQSKGCRVEILGFGNVSRELRDAADQYINGYLVPGLLATDASPDSRARWGSIGSRVRGVCNRFDHQEGRGFLNFWPEMPRASIVTASETKGAYFRTASLVDAQIVSKLPSRQYVFEFDLIEPAKPDGLPEARRIVLVN